jgi:hypothetical protein
MYQKTNHIFEFNASNIINLFGKTNELCTQLEIFLKNAFWRESGWGGCFGPKAAKGAATH